MRDKTKRISVLFLIICTVFSFMPVSGESVSYEGYGQTGFYGEYHPSEDSNNTLSVSEKKDAGMLVHEKIPDAGDSFGYYSIFLAFFPFLAVLFLIQNLNRKNHSFRKI